MRGQLTSAADVRTFALGGNATLTFESLKTGSRFTYRIRSSDDGRVHFVGVQTGTSNERFTYLGIVKNGTFKRGRKSPIAPDAMEVRAFTWAASVVLTGAELPETLRVYHEGRCGRCGRKLTVPGSITTGFGPECAGRIGRSS